MDSSQPLVKASGEFKLRCDDDFAGPINITPSFSVRDPYRSQPFRKILCIGKLKIDSNASLFIDVPQLPIVIFYNGETL
ncbi:hypothetical protein BBO01nite_43440 [Brevibacillus borstelensis]|nr:hypothetical protein BBO01nite_43440 [Brevibacillus borstelensis]